ncbi:uncharacterized protein [Primulina eburnea]|uniref:uncharacterized protein n=1 Tax=Primulina eburnea TaxID=1245227 RepID=UPI003C6BF515
MNKACQSKSDVALATAEEEHVVEEAQYINNNRGYGGYRGNPPSNTYLPGLRNHENFSYATNKNVLNLPPGFNTQKGEGKSFENLIGKFLAESGKRMIEQLANALKDQNRGQFPSNTEVNPMEKEPTEENVEILVEEDDGKDVSVGKKIVEKPKKVCEQQPLPKVNLPYPHRFKKKEVDDQFAKFLEIFKKIHINIPFADALEQMTNYAKFIKDMMSKKRKLQEFEKVKLTEECSAILQRKLPQKLKDQGIFTILCVIGSSRLADVSLTYPRGIVEDVLVKGELTLRVGGEEVVFKIYNTIRGPNGVDERFLGDMLIGISVYSG